MGEDLIELIETDPKNCVACLSCLRACPVNCIAAREGEDNFILVLPGTNKTRAFALAEKLRKKIEGSRFVCGKLRIPSP